MSMIMIPAFGEILACADSADSAGPTLSGTHFGQQRQCGARVRKRSAVSGSPAELASPIRLGSMSARQAAKASRPAHIKGIRYGRQWPAEPSTDSHPVIPPAPKGDNAREATVRCEGPTSEGRCHNIIQIGTFRFGLISEPKGYRNRTSFSLFYNVVWPF